MSSARINEIVSRLQELHSEEQRLLIELEIELKKGQTQAPPPPKVEHKIVLSAIKRDESHVIMTVRRRGNKWIKRDVSNELPPAHADVIIDRLNSGIYISDDSTTDLPGPGTDRYVYLMRNN